MTLRSVFAAIFIFIILIAPSLYAEDNSYEPPVPENTIAALKPGLLINLAKPEGIEKGALLSVVRDGKVVGSVEVLEVIGKDLAKGAIITGEGEIEIGDVVTTKKMNPPEPPPVPEPPAPVAKPNPAPENNSVTVKPVATESQDIQYLQKRIEALEKRVAELEAALKIPVPPPVEKPLAIPAPSDNEASSPEFDRTVEKMLDSKAKPKTPEAETKAPAPAQPSREYISTSEGMNARNPDDVPEIKGKVIGTYNKDREMGIAVGENNKVKPGYIFYIFRLEKEGAPAKLIAKVRITDTTSLKDTVGGPIILQTDAIRKTDFASTRMPAGK